jgi:hypothetical protein
MATGVSTISRVCLRTSSLPVWRQAESDGPAARPTKRAPYALTYGM